MVTLVCNYIQIYIERDVMLSNSIMCKVCVTGELLKVDLKHKCLALYFFIGVTDHMDT